MEGTGTNLRLTMNPPVNSEFEAVYQSALSNLPGSTVDQGFIGSRGRFRRRQHPAVGSQRAARRGAAVEPDRRVSTSRQQRAQRRLCRPARHAPDRRHAVLPEGPGHSRARRRCPVPTWRAIRRWSARSRRSPARSRERTRSTTRCRSRCTSVSASGLEYQISYTWAHGMSDSIGYYGDSGQSGAQSAYMQNLYDRRSEWSPQLADVKHNFVASYYLRAARSARARSSARHWAKPRGLRDRRLADGRDILRAHRLPADHQDHGPLGHPGAQRPGPGDRDAATIRTSSDRAITGWM